MYLPAKCAKKQISASSCPMQAMFQFSRIVRRVKYLKIYGLYKFDKTTQAQNKSWGTYKNFLVKSKRE